MPQLQAASITPSNKCASFRPHISTRVHSGTKATAIQGAVDQLVRTLAASADFPRRTLDNSQAAEISAALGLHLGVVGGNRLSRVKVSLAAWDATAARVASQAFAALNLAGVAMPTFCPDRAAFVRLVGLRDEVTISWARRTLPDGADEVADGLDYLVACLGDRAAMARLAASLKRMHKLGTTLPGELRELAATLSEAWCRLSHSSLRRSPDPFADASRIIREQTFSLDDLDVWATTQAITLPPQRLSGVVPPRAHTGPMLRVIERIGDATSKDGIEATRRFLPLLSPLPLSVGPNPDVLWRILQQEFPWMEEANTAIAEAAALSGCSSAAHFRLNPLILVGPAGVGKTRWARRAAAACSIAFGSLSLAGMTSSMLITGAERGWSSAGPGHVARVISECGFANPLILVDEADKACEGRQNGNPLDALIPLLERETAKRHYDTYLLGNLDLSAVSWILTANSLSAIGKPLLTRLRVVQAGRPMTKHLPAIISGLLENLRCEMGGDIASIPETGELVAQLEKSFSADPCIRTLATMLQKIVVARVWAPPGLRVV